LTPAQRHCVPVIQSKLLDPNPNIECARNLDADSKIQTIFDINGTVIFFSQTLGSLSYTNDYRYSKTKNDVRVTLFFQWLDLRSRYRTFNHLFKLSKIKIK